MVWCAEPGYYHEGAFGIRIENLVVVVPAATPHKFNNQQFLTFETITLVPMDRNLTDVSMLAPEELEWYCSCPFVLSRARQPAHKCVP